MPQGSVLGPVLFLIYINDITQNIKSDCLLYAEDTSLFDVVEDPALSFSKLSDNLNSFKGWPLKWLVTINPSKTKCMTFSAKRNKPSHPVLLFDGTPIEEVPQHKH